MNIPSANDDEDFPVFKAGPPLPIRAKPKTVSKSKGVPLKATETVITTKPSTKQGSVLAPFTVTNTPVISAESKVKQYIEKVKASDELGRRKRIKPEQMLSLEELYQVNVNSKLESPNSAEDKDNDLSLGNIQDKLRETLRIVKEKDALINKLRESCHDLAIKCADAENRVDELRFSYGRSSFSGAANQSSGNATTLRKQSMDEQHLMQHSSGCIPRRCVSAEGLQNCGVGGGEQDAAAGKGNQEKIDKATETSNSVMRFDAETQIETSPRRNDQWGNDRLSEQEVSQWQQEDDILQETCSNWLEKVQNWKTDSNFNLSQDSGGDKDSGFRGSSAEVDAESILKQRYSSYVKSHRKCQGQGKTLKVPHASRNGIAQPPQMSSSSATTITVQPTCNHHHHHHSAENVEEHEHVQQQHFWPSFSSSQSQLNLSNYHSGTFHSDSTKAKSLFYELAETNRNKCSYFQESRSKCDLHRLAGTKSLDALYFPPTPPQTAEELRSLIDSSFEPPEFILKSHLASQHRAVDRKVKILGPLLDDTTQIALRVKMKTERLAKMLNNACTLE